MDISVEFRGAVSVDRNYICLALATINQHVLSKLVSTRFKVCPRRLLPPPNKIVQVKDLCAN